MKFEEMCAFIQRIETNPEEKITGVTIGDFLQMQHHITVCKPCDDSSRRVVERGYREGKLQKEGPSEN